MEHEQVSQQQPARSEYEGIEWLKRNRSMKRFFTLEYWRDDGWYVGKLKEVPGVFSQGKTLEELKENIIDAYRMMLN
jgi:hypothetical protein